MKVTVIEEPLLEFGKGTHICPRNGIERMGVYDTKDELRRSELRLGIVGRGEGVDKLDVWLDLCRSGIVGKESELSNLFKGFGGVSADYGFFTRLLSSPGFTRALQKSSIVSKILLKSSLVKAFNSTLIGNLP